MGGTIMIRKSLPNFFTVGNLAMGLIAIILVFNDKPELGAIMIIIAMLLDGLDGRVARALNAQSDFGKELDSLSDVISFGVAPAFVMYVMAFQNEPDLHVALTWIATVIFPICGALRLARFNVSSDDTPGYFIGMPIPMAGGALAMLAIFHGRIAEYTGEHAALYVLMGLTFLLSYLMISKHKYPSFKKAGIPKSLIWVLIGLLILTLVVIIWFQEKLAELILVPFLIYIIYGFVKKKEPVSSTKSKKESA
jgi:CDP-diacylglycerol--serine O-phosphatidyltransferase